MEMIAKTICVTGATGFIASHVVKKLLERGYVVHGTVRNVADVTSYAHLTALPQAKEKLHLFEANLLEEQSFATAMKGCEVVIHLASPVQGAGFTTEENSVRPAVDGTKNVLQTVQQQPKVRRVVLTSSICTLFKTYGALPSDHIYTESDWSNMEELYKREQFYAYGKTLAEKTAWEFMEQLGDDASFDLVTILPGMTLGQVQRPVLNSSVRPTTRYLTGERTLISRNSIWTCDVQDVAEAHILAFEKQDAKGRFIISAVDLPDSELCAMIRQYCPSAPVPTEMESKQEQNGWEALSFSNAKSIEILGLHYRPIQDTVRDTLSSLYALGLTKFPIETK